MAQCYAESKPIGGTFDMHGGGYTGRLYCSGYGSEHLKQFQSYNPKFAVAAGNNNSAELIVPMFLRQRQHQQQQQHPSSRVVPKTAEVVNSSIPSLKGKGASVSADADRMSTALAVYKDETPKPPMPEGSLVRKLSGEMMPKKVVDPLPQASSTEFGGFHRFDADGTDKLSAAGKSAAACKSGSSSVRSSGEITEMVESLPSGSGNGSGGLKPSAFSKASSGTTTSGTTTSSHQSWPSSPANFRPAPRTRNLSEGSFSMIFPDEGHRLYSTSPGRVRSKETKQVDFQEKVGRPIHESKISGQKPSKVTANSDPKQPLFKGQMKRGELKEIGGKTRSYTGSPPRTATKESPFIRHSRNVSDGNWGALNSLRGSVPRSNLPTSKHQVSPADVKNTTVLRPSPTLKTPSEGLNTGFVTGGSFARNNCCPPAEKPCVVDKSPELVTPSYGNITRGLTINGNSDRKKGTSESYGTGNVYLMGESMLLKKALCSKDAEEVKSIGNEQYKKGHFVEALSLYDRAISLSPGQAPYHSNRAAALAALGRLAEAVQECQEALLLDPWYSRAHQRLGTLFLRLGWTEDARKHFQCVIPIDAGDIQRTENVSSLFAKSYEARRLRNWQAVVEESDAAVVAGADSSVQAYALKAVALLKLRNVHEAEKVIFSAKKLGANFVKQKNVVDQRMLLIVQAEIDLAEGRFDEALHGAEKASFNEPSNAEVCAFEKKVRRLVRARARGNELFKSAKYFEASAAYGEGLELDPENAILYCNRAACRSKLRLWEKAIEDCNAALVVQPSYTKALLRRAQCHSQLERWENAVRDYEVLKSKLPGDVEVARALFEVQVASKKAKGEDVYKFRFGGEIEEVYSPDQFKEAITSPGLAVVHFITRWSERCKQMTPFVDLLCKRYPSVNFVKVDIEDHPFLAKTEAVGTVPTFKMYKNGLKVTEMLGPSQQKLEDAVQHYIC